MHVPFFFKRISLWLAWSFVISSVVATSGVEEDRLLLLNVQSASIADSVPGEGDAKVTVSFASGPNARALEYTVACYDHYHNLGPDVAGLRELFVGYSDIVQGVNSSDEFAALMGGLEAEAWGLWDGVTETVDTCGTVAIGLEPLGSTAGTLEKGYTKQEVDVDGLFCQQDVSCFVTVGGRASACQFAGSVTIPGYDITPGGSWTTVGAAGFSSDEASSTQLAINKAGVIYAAYKDGVAGPATVSVFDGTAWEGLGPNGGAVSDNEAAFVRIAIGPAGTIYVAYQDVSAGQMPWVKRYDPTTASWEAVGTGPVLPSGVTDLSLVTDSQGSVYLAFAESLGVNPGGLTVMRFDGHEEWEPVGGHQFSAGQSFYISLAIGPDDRLFVSYTDSSSGDRVSVQTYDSVLDTWAFVGSNGHGISSSAAWFTSLALAPDGVPYVAWSALGDGDKLGVAVLSVETDTWIAAGNNAPIIAPTAYAVSLAIDSNGTPFVAYVAGLPSGDIHALMLEGDTWQHLCFEGIRPVSTGSGTNLALNACNVPYLVYRDGLAEDGATVSRFFGA